MKFKKQILKDSVLDGCNYKEEGIEFIEMSGWEDEGKYSFQTYIFKHNNKYYSISDSRSGSYFSDYNYDSEYWDDEVECDEVEKKEKITYEWVTIK
jgi:hypothetical protein